MSTVVSLLQVMAMKNEQRVRKRVPETVTQVVGIQFSFSFSCSRLKTQDTRLQTPDSRLAKE